MAGIRCLYQGTELGLTDEKGRIGQAGETSRLSLDLSGAVKGGSLRKSESFVSVARLTKARSLIPVLRTGATVPLWSDSPDGPDDDGVFAFARVGSHPGDFVIVVINASDAERVTGAGDFSMLLVDGGGKPLAAQGSQLRRLVAVGPVDTTLLTTTLGSINGIASAKLSVPAQSLVIYAPVK